MAFFIFKNNTPVKYKNESIRPLYVPIHSITLYSSTYSILTAIGTHSVHHTKDV